jgi:molybdenum cofactor guanylyltransferase
MGTDKALLQLGGESLLERSLKLVRGIVSGVKIVGDPAKYMTFGPVVADIYAGRGPLGGIHAALANTTTDLNLILATDLPFIEPAFLQELIATAQAGNALVTAPSMDGYFEPLCAVYRTEFCDVAQKALAEGRNKVDALFSANITRVVTKDEIVRAGFSPAMFRNLNTSEDLAQAKKELSR